MNRESQLEARIRLVQGDITDLDVDAVVNAANRGLMGGGGVDGAIHRTGGPAILAACEEIRRKRYPDGLPTGQAVITTGGRLPARHVIHTVGPVWCGGERGGDELLADAYRNCLALAAEHGLGSVTFPSISTGAYRFPRERAARIAIRTVRAFLAEHSRPRVVVFCAYDRADHDLYAGLLGEDDPGGEL